VGNHVIDSYVAAVVLIAYWATRAGPRSTPSAVLMMAALSVLGIFAVATVSEDTEPPHTRSDLASVLNAIPDRSKRTRPVNPSSPFR
jgi:hypothetical protein